MRVLLNFGELEQPCTCASQASVLDEFLFDVYMTIAQTKESLLELVPLRCIGMYNGTLAQCGLLSRHCRCVLQSCTRPHLLAVAMHIVMTS